VRTRLLLFCAGALCLAASTLAPWVSLRGTKGTFRASLLYSFSPEVFPLAAATLLVLCAIYAWRRWIWTLELMRLGCLAALIAVLPFVSVYRSLARVPRRLDIYTEAMRDLIGEPIAASLSWGPWIAVAAAVVCYLCLVRLPTRPWPAWCVYLLIGSVLAIGDRMDYLTLYGISVGRIEPRGVIAKNDTLRALTGVQVEGFGTPKIQAAKTGALAPPFALKGATGPDMALAQFRGERVLVNFWATWCGPCIAEMPALEQLYNKHKNDRFRLLAISVDEEAAKVEPFMRARKLTFPALFSTRDVERAYGVNAYPTSFLIDAQGKIIWSVVGALNDERTQQIDALLASR
jgi:thiol-disulfide isomerase/thioredoxin